jgi:uncharacterized membrane protein YkoI
MSLERARERMNLKFLKTMSLAICLGLPIAGIADDDDDARFATQALREGKILSLSEILERVEGVIGNNILEVEMEHEDEGLVYEVYFLDPEGRRREIYVDAVTGKILMQKIDDDSDAHSTD